MSQPHPTASRPGGLHGQPQSHPPSIPTSSPSMSSKAGQIMGTESHHSTTESSTPAGMDYGNISSLSTSVLSQGRSRIADLWYSITTPVANFLAPFLNAVTMWTSSILDAAKVYWDGYPAIRAFVYMWAALTAIPNLIFLGYAAISFSIVGGIALVGVTVVEGGILGFGMLFLGPVLFFSGLAALIGTSLFTALLYSLRATSITLGTAQEASGLRTGVIGGAISVAKNTTAMSADLASKAEAFVTGPSGMPHPISGRV